MRDRLIRNFPMGSEMGLNHSKSMYDHNEKFSLKSEEFDSGGASSIGVKEKAGFSFKNQFSMEKSEKMQFLNFRALKKIITHTKKILVVQNECLQLVLYPKF